MRFSFKFDESKALVEKLGHTKGRLNARKMGGKRSGLVHNHALNIIVLKRFYQTKGLSR